MHQDSLNEREIQSGKNWNVCSTIVLSTYYCVYLSNIRCYTKWDLKRQAIIITLLAAVMMAAASTAILYKHYIAHYYRNYSYFPLIISYMICSDIIALIFFLFLHYFCFFIVILFGPRSLRIKWIKWGDVDENPFFAFDATIRLLITNAVNLIFFFSLFCRNYHLLETSSLCYTYRFFSVLCKAGAVTSISQDQK